MKQRLQATFNQFGPGAGLRLGKALVIAALVLVAVTALWRGGALQFLELQFFDHRVRLSERQSREDSPVVLVAAMKEAELENPEFGCWPISDQKLVELIERIAAAGPRTIGVDLLRPVPVPCGSAETASLRSLLERNTNVVMAHSLPRLGQPGTRPPASLANRVEQLGVVNPFPAAEPGNVTRRVILYEDRRLYETEPQRYWSLGAQLARRFLTAEGIHWEEVQRHGQIFDVLGKIEIQPLEPNDGCYVGLDPGGYQFLLNFSGPAAYPTHSFSEVFAGRVPAEIFRDKAVLIGTLVESLPDKMATPLNVLQPGVEVHAHTACQLILGARTGRGVVRFFNEWQEGAWLVLAVALGLAAGMGASGLLPFLLCLVLGVAGIYFGGCVAFAHGYWIPVILPMAGFVPTTALVQVFRFDEERKLRGRITGIFGQHVSPNVLKLILAEQGRLESRTVLTTVFFADLKGFTALAHSLSPQEVVNWLNQFTEIMSQPVLRRNGMVIDFIGDAILAGFGLPIPLDGEDAHRTNAINAVNAALELGAAVGALSEKMKAAGRPETAVRIGICSGAVVAGIVGSTERLKYTVIGNTVNTAARLESVDLAEELGVNLPVGSFRLLVSEETWQLVGAHFTGRCLGKLRLKNLPEPVPVHQITGAKTQPQPS